MKTEVYVKDISHQVAEKSNMWLADGKDRGVALFKRDGERPMLC